MMSSSFANLWAHLLSRLLRSSDVGLLLDFFLLGFGDSFSLLFCLFFFSCLFFFCSSTSLYSSQQFNFRRVLENGGGHDRGGRNRHLLFFLPGSVGGGDNCWTCSGMQAIQITQSIFCMQGSSPIPYICIVHNSCGHQTRT